MAQKISSPQNSLFRFIIRSTFHKAKIEKPLNSFLEHGQVQAVHNVLAAALIHYQPGIFQNVQVVAYGWLCHIKVRSNITGTNLAFTQQFQNAPPGGVPQSLKRIAYHRSALLLI